MRVIAGKKANERSFVVEDESERRGTVCVVRFLAEFSSFLSLYNTQSWSFVRHVSVVCFLAVFLVSFRSPLCSYYSEFLFLSSSVFRHPPLIAFFGSHLLFIWRGKARHKETTTIKEKTPYCHQERREASGLLPPWSFLLYSILIWLLSYRFFCFCRKLTLTWRQEKERKRARFPSPLIVLFCSVFIWSALVSFFPFLSLFFVHNTHNRIFRHERDNKNIRNCCALVPFCILSSLVTRTHSISPKDNAIYYFSFSASLCSSSSPLFLTFVFFVRVDVYSWRVSSWFDKAFFFLLFLTMQSRYMGDSRSQYGRNSRRQCSFSLSHHDADLQTALELSRLESERQKSKENKEQQDLGLENVDCEDKSKT